MLCLFFDLTSFWTSSWLHCTHKETTQHGNSIYESQTGRFSTGRWGVPYQGPGICMSEDTVFGQPCFWQYPYCPWQYRSPLGFCSPNGPSWLFALFTRLTAHLYWCGSTNLYSRHSAWLDGGGKRHSCHNHPVDHRSPKGPSLQTSWTTSICCCISVICTRYFLFSRLSFFPSTERSQFQVGGMLGGKLCVLVLDKFFVFYGHTVQIYFTSFDLVSVFCSFFDSTHTKKQHNMATPSMTVELAGFQHGDGVPHQGPGLCMSKDTVFGQLCLTAPVLSPMVPQPSELLLTKWPIMAFCSIPFCLF